LTLVEWGGEWAGEFGETVVEMRINSELGFGREINFASFPPSGDSFLRRVESVLT